MQKISFVLIAIFGLLTTAYAQNKTTPDVSDQLINTMHQYEVDVQALNRVYFIKASPEKRERYKRLANDYLSKISSVPFQSLTQEGKADFVLFKRDLDQDIYKAFLMKQVPGLLLRAYKRLYNSPIVFIMVTILSLPGGYR